jgi:RTX calcium-binding nonapeptide repeat (4 copies)
VRRKLRGSRRSDGRSGQTLLISVVAVFGLAVAVAAGPAVAEKITGTNRSERIVGTNKSDTINGKGGKDLIKGKGGNDKLRGGKGGDLVAGGKGRDLVAGGDGRDLVVGGKGDDRHLGGPGNDVLKAADGGRDSVINGGSGANKCIVDVVELSIVKNCRKVQAVGGGGGGGGGGSTQGLRVLTADVMCSPQPALLGCNFHISGDGADAAGPGTVEGSGGVTNVLGTAGSLSPPTWDALGAYTCTAAGSLRITIGSKSVDVPVPCTPG